MSDASRTLALCADDFGLSAHISDAIIELAQQQHLTSVSCITNADHFPIAGKLLHSQTRDVEVGLHFNLSEGRALSPALAHHWPALPSIGKLILYTHLGGLPRSAIEDELEAQWQMFCRIIGREPDFIDGHQHIHDLPGIREIVLDKAHTQHRTPWIRNTGSIAGPNYTIKRRIIEYTGGMRLQQLLRKQHISCNAILSGVYDFTNIDYRALMQRWLAQLPEQQGLIFCHPALPEADAQPGSMAHCRATEYRYLNSDAFVQDLHAAGVILQPLNRQSAINRL